MMCETDQNPWEDKAILERLYVDERMSTIEIAEELDCHRETVRKWLHKHDIEVSKKTNHPPGNISHYFYNGYECISHRHGDESHGVRVQRLIAVSEYGFDSVKDKHIHHVNGVKWDNRPENLQPMDPSEHIKEHNPVEQRESWDPENWNRDRGETKVGHCKQDEIDVYIGRGPNGRHMLNTDVGDRGWLGNPYTLEDHSREESIEKFRDALMGQLSDDEFYDELMDLSGKTLGCWCQRVDDDSPACHGEVIADLADRLYNHR